MRSDDIETTSNRPVAKTPLCQITPYDICKEHKMSIKGYFYNNFVTHYEYKWFIICFHIIWSKYNIQYGITEW